VVRVSAAASIDVDVMDANARGDAEDLRWFRAAPVEAFPEDGGACVMAGGEQIAVFNFARRDEWYACQNLCPHKQQMALSRGLLGSTGGVAKVACPYHKTAFSLETGACLSSNGGADIEAIRTYPVRVEDGWVHIGLPTDGQE
jgi:nitrite reductase (NADH) small subunit